MNHIRRKGVGTEHMIVCYVDRILKLPKMYDTPDVTDVPNIATEDEVNIYGPDLWMEVGGKRKRNSVEKLERKLRARTKFPPRVIAQIIVNTFAPRRPNQ